MEGSIGLSEIKQTYKPEVWQISAQKTEGGKGPGEEGLLGICVEARS